MATIAIGDIHGNLAALRDLLKQLRSVLHRDDTIVFLGDYIDRGAESKGCIEEILTLQSEYPGHVICLSGNHENWLLRTRRDHSRHSWLVGMNGYVTIRSYSPDAERTLRHAVKENLGRVYENGFTLPYDAFFQAMPATYLSFLERLT